MADFEEINRLIQIKINEAYKNGHKEGMEYRKEIIEGAMKEEYQRGYNKGKEAVILASTEYQRGYKDALEAKETIALSTHCDNLNEALNRGRDEAWELARKICNMPCETAQQFFNTIDYTDIVLGFSLSEIMEKIKAYEEKQDDTDINDGSKQFLQLTSRDLKNNEGYVRPYYEIEWLEDGVKHVGYGSFNLSCTLNWLSEYFGIHAISGEIEER